MPSTRLIKAGLTYTICNVILRGISFLTIPLFIRLLSPDEFGRYNVFVSFEGILFIFSALTIHASIKNAKYDLVEKYEAYIKNCVYLDFFNSLILCFIANLISFFFVDVIDLTNQEVTLLCISGFCQAVVSIYSAKLVMDYKSGDFVIVSFISVIFGIGFSLLFIFSLFTSNHYLGRVWGGVAGQLLAATYIIFQIFKSGFVPINIKDWIYGLKITLPIIPHGLSQIVLSSANRVMIKYIYNATLAGIFSLTYTISLIPQILFSSIDNVWEPWFFEQMSKRNFEKISSVSTHFCILISLVFVAMSCVVPELVKLLATKEYYEAIDISIVVLLGCYFATLYYIPCEIEYYYKKTGYIAVSTVTCAVINITLNYFLMKHFSYKVASYVTLLTYFLYFIFHMIIARRIEKHEFINVKWMILTIILSIMAMALNLVLINVFFARICILLVVSIVSILLYHDYIIKYVNSIKSRFINP